MSKCKKLTNDVAICVEDCLQGLVAVNPGLRLLEGHRVIIRSDIDHVKAAGKVTLLSGGGSGHEPAHAGYVGPGMLSGAIAGSVFASPPPESILAAIRTVSNVAGTLLIIKNYTGDRLNFGIAAERAKAEGLRVEMVVVGEDCALTSEDKTAGRRGLCGTVFIHKIAGAMAEEGKPINDIVKVTQTAAGNMGTIGLSLSPCSIPGSGPSFQLGEDEIELGLGIHGEAGVKRMKILPAKEAVGTMLDHMTNPQSSTHLQVRKGDSVALMVNNLGGTSVLELNIVANEAIQCLASKGVDVDRAYCGSFMTSLEMAGVSLTVLHLDDTRAHYLDMETQAPGWAAPLLPAGTTKRSTPGCIPYRGHTSHMSAALTGQKVQEGTASLIYKALKAACTALSNSEVQLNDFDRESGDGDCGSTHKKGATAIIKALGERESPGLPVQQPSDLLLAIGALVEQHMGGSSGALYSLFFSAAASALAGDCSILAWSEALKAGLHAIMKYGRAKPGDRTMVDAFDAASQTLANALSTKTPIDAFESAVKAAEEAVESTTSMKASAGRASYVSSDHLKNPDPGAHAVAIWMRAILEVCK